MDLFKTDQNNVHTQTGYQDPKINLMQFNPNGVRFCKSTISAILPK